MTIEELTQQKDRAYWERNQLVLALTKIFPSWLSRHEGADWEDDWRNIVFIEIPTETLEQKYIQGGFLLKQKQQVSWHIHDSELHFFSHLEERPNVWDGHTTEDKYWRLANINPPKFWITVRTAYSHRVALAGEH